MVTGVAAVTSAACSFSPSAQAKELQIRTGVPASLVGVWKSQASAFVQIDEDGNVVLDTSGNEVVLLPASEEMSLYSADGVALSLFGTHSEIKPLIWPPPPPSSDGGVQFTTNAFLGVTYAKWSGHVETEDGAGQGVEATFFRYLYMPRKDASGGNFSDVLIGYVIGQFKGILTGPDTVEGTATLKTVCSVASECAVLCMVANPGSTSSTCILRRGKGSITQTRVSLDDLYENPEL